MKNPFHNFTHSNLLTPFLAGMLAFFLVQTIQAQPNKVFIDLSNNRHLIIDFYSDNIFRLFMDKKSGSLREPEARPEAKILVDNARKNMDTIAIVDKENVTVTTNRLFLEVNKQNGMLRVTDRSDNRVILEQLLPTELKADKTTLTLKEFPEEYFYGGGVQNGRFSHKGHIIKIVNENTWTDGGVASPAPFYWSTNGYGLMCYTFKPGVYDFGATEKGKVKITHDTPYLDVFIFVDKTPTALLNDYYQLTGHPVLLPKFAFYEGHLNAYNRDYWKENAQGILFEDGKRYKESQKDSTGIKESLNGEKNNYQFSARAVIDRYKQHDMPLGWILPNDGYGAGYGQTATLDGNIQNLKEFGDYARKNGVEIGLWTQSDLHPIDTVKALLQRDIVKEVRDAGVRVLKTDVAWVGDGYSFGLNGVSEVGGYIMPHYGNNARPFIITVDGWAGTQRYSSVWAGDEKGGEWEYIRFMIPTYIGAGLSGQPNITSDMDGIFGGKNRMVNTRDFQWKTFTPMQLNMDGWGLNEKYPQALGEPATSINRMYLKLKSQLLPYTYSIAQKAVSGLPMMRAMFLDYPNDFTYGKATQYQYMYGPNFLIAPIYKSTRADKEGNDVRDSIYLPKGKWFDYFTGDVYEGGQMLNNFSAPLWKLPVFVKAGSIIPMANANNNVSEINRRVRCYEVYPYKESSFTEYDDDGTTLAYQSGESSLTLIQSFVDEKQNAFVVVNGTLSSFNGQVIEKSTKLVVNLRQQPKGVTAEIGGRKVKLKEVHSKEELAEKEDVYFYDAKPNLNRFATTGSDFEKVVITKNPQLIVKLHPADIEQLVEVRIKGFVL